VAVLHAGLGCGQRENNDYYPGACPAASCEFRSVCCEKGVVREGKEYPSPVCILPSVDGGGGTLIDGGAAACR
jgi:hypothetical protein